MSFRGGVRDISFNRVAVYYTGVDVYNDTAFFKGSNRLLIWRYQNYDYRDKLQISFKFKPVPGPRLEPYTLVSNCEGVDEPSYGIVLNTTVNIITIFLKTDEIKDQRIMTFDINVRMYLYTCVLFLESCLKSNCKLFCFFFNLNFINSKIINVCFSVV